MNPILKENADLVPMPPSQSNRQNNSPPSAGENSQAGKTGGLWVRIASAVALIAVVTAMIVPGGILYSLFLTGVAGLAMTEWYKLSGVPDQVDRYTKGTAIAGMILAVPAAGAIGIKLAVALIIAFSLCLVILQAYKLPLKTRIMIAAGFSYITFGASVLNEIRNIPVRYTVEGQGIYWPTILIILLVALTDTGAYFAGKRFGRHKLAPQISPGKTWEGLAGGVILSLMFALLYHALWLQELLLIWEIALLAILIPFVAQGGDLFISLLKRRQNLKDTGRLIPGHGGILDRIDGLLAALPVFLTWFWLIAAQ